MADAVHTPETVTAQMQADIVAANSVTGNTDTTIHDAVTALIAGFGSGGITLLESGSFTLAAISNRYNVELTEAPDLFICYAEVSETDTSYNALDGAICVNIPQIAHVFPYETNKASNVNILINWYTTGAHQLLGGYAYISTSDTGAVANVVARSASYPLMAKTYKWESYKMWK